MAIKDFQCYESLEHLAERSFLENSLQAVTKNIENLEELVRELRKNLYLRTQYRQSPEREWETEGQVRARMENNRLNREAWDKVTEKMLRDAKCFV